MIEYLPVGTASHDSVVKDQVSIHEGVVLLHQPLVLLGNRQVEEAALAYHGAAEAGSRAVLLFALSEGTIVKTEFFAVFDSLLSEHPN